MAAVPLNADLDCQGTAKVINVPSPVNPGDVANKQYVDALAGGGAALGLQDWWDYQRIVPSNTQFGIISPAAISAGSNNATLPAASVFSWNPFGTFMRSSTTANSGYRYTATNNGGIYFGGGIPFKCRCQYLWTATSFTNTTFRIGFHDTTSNAAPADGCYFEVVAGVLSCITANNSVRTTGGTTLTLTANVVYTLDVDVNGAGTEARFRVYADQNPTPVLDQTITTNIPTTTARATGLGWIGTNSGTTAQDLGILYSIAYGTLNGFNKWAGLA